MPSRSLGNMSLVNWTRWKLHSSARAIACPSVVLPTPGTPSMSRWPRAKIETSARRTTSSFPRMIVRSALSSCAARLAAGAPAWIPILSRFYYASTSQTGTEDLDHEGHEGRFVFLCALGGELLSIFVIERTLPADLSAARSALR